MGDFIRYDVREVDLNKPLLRTNTGVLLATGDRSANRFGAILHRDGEPVDLTGQVMMVMGFFVRPDGNTVVCKGAQNGNMVYVDLPAACYAQSGAFSLAIKVSSPDTTQTVRVIDGVIRLTSTDAIADPGEKVINISELLKMIEDAEAAADRAEAAADRAEAAGGNSGTGTGEDGYSPVIAQDTAPTDTSVLWVDTSDSAETNPVYVNPLYGKKIVFNGDSICAGSDADGTLGGYGKIIADRNGMTYQNIAKGGLAVTAGICRTIGSMNADADYAIIEGGINDSSYSKPMGAIIDGYSGTLDDTTYCGAFESMLKQLILRFQGKKIGYIAVHANGDGYSYNTTDNYHSKALECCAKWGVPVCDLTALVPAIGRIPELRSAYTVGGDGVHPTAEGYRLFYVDKIEAWLRTL